MNHQPGLARLAGYVPAGPDVKYPMDCPPTTAVVILLIAKPLNRKNTNLSKQML